MKKRHLGLMAAIFVITASAALGAEPANAPSQDSLFSLLPENTVAAVRLTSIQQGSANLNAFTLTAAGLPLGDQLEKLILEAVDLSSLEGVDLTKPLWLFYGLDESTEQTLSMLVPFSDWEKAASASELEKNEAGVYNTGKRSILFRDGMALFSDGEMEESQKAWFASAPFEKIASLTSNPKDDLSVWLRMTSVAKTLRDLSGTLLESMDGLMALAPTAPVNVTAMMQTEIGWILDMLDQTDIVRLGLQLTSEALTLQKQVVLKEGSPMLEYFRSSQLANPAEVLSIINPKNVVSMALNLDPKVYELIRERVLKDCAELKFDAEAMKSLWDEGIKMYKGPVGFALNASTKPDKPVAFTELIAVKKIDDVGAFFDNMSKVIQDSANLVGSVSGVALEIKEEKNIGTYKNIPYSKLAIRYKADDPESPMAELFAKQNQDYFYALTDKALIFTTENITEVLDRALEAKTASLPSFVKPNSLAAIRINLLEALRSVKQTLAQNPTGINPLQMVEIPAGANNPGVVIEAHLENGNPISSLTIPVQEIVAVRNAVMGAMMQQQGGNPDSGDEEEEEPEEE